METGWKEWKNGSKTERMTMPFYVDSALRTTFSALYAQIKNKINKNWERERERENIVNRNK